MPTVKNKALEICRSNARQNPISDINREHPWIKEVAQSLRDIGCVYAGVKVFEEGELVYSWRKEEKFVEPTSFLDPNREPHLWIKSKRRKK